MIIGAHSIIYSKRPEADRAFFDEILGLPSVDAGGGWLIFGLPPSEVAPQPTIFSSVPGVHSDASLAILVGAWTELRDSFSSAMS